jgi:hypothetical protein
VQRLEPGCALDIACGSGVPAEEWQERVLDDGSRHRIYKRYLSAGQLAGEVLLVGTAFVAVRAVRR